MLLCVVYVVWIYRSSRKLAGNHTAPIQRPPAYAKRPTLPDLTSQEEEEDFISFTGPVITTNKPTIPHIIHQLWDTDKVPRYFAAFIRSWQQKHPDWEYWFWTKKDANEFVKAEYPEHYALYDSYISPIFRADAMRYFVLYKYGGVYADLDMEALKPLDNWTYGYQCILSQECYEHSFVVQELEHTNLLNGFLATRPGHPFFLKLIESLPEFGGRYFGHYIKATGPLFIDAVYKRYKANFTSDLTKPEDRVTVVPPKYFIPTFDPSQSEIISSRCYPLNTKSLKPKGKRVCQSVQDKFFQNKPEPESYTNHEWIHAYLFDENWRTSNTIQLYKLAPNAVDVSLMFKRFEN